MTEKFRMNAATFIDSLGKVRITVSAAHNGEPYIAILDNEGNIKAMFSVDPDNEPFMKRTK